MVESGRITYKELSMINEVIPNLSQEHGLRNVEQNFEAFLEAVKIKSPLADASWQCILRSFLFHPEAVRIVAFLNEQCQDMPKEKKREIRLAIQMNECQFDCDTVSAYLHEEQKRSALATDPDENFQNYIRVKSR